MKKGLLFMLFLVGGLLSLQAQQDTTYKSYLGKYRFSDGSVIPTVEISGDSLKALTIISEAGTSPMEYVAPDKFTITNFSGTADFKRHDTTKQVIAIHIEAMGYVLDGTKEDNGNRWAWSVNYTRTPLYAILKK